MTANQLWVCGDCGFHVFMSRWSCMKCGFDYHEGVKVIKRKHSKSPNRAGVNAKQINKAVEAAVAKALGGARQRGNTSATTSSCQSYRTKRPRNRMPIWSSR
eukprot:TRINITY_DN52657_c0_g1_i1.p1 TRINITY_DN52657_c0_g1~~TRINITY_DN52657_c0_g1_i1.p1  ORF type:complete len:114 (-),score=24.49 TRINITY_DN52657_c0_g1_i1:17-322(-)